jgi:crossover junction endodeoxyribonuclease RusA
MTAVTRFTIVLPRVHLLTANQRLHWAQKAARNRIIRTRAKVAAQTCSFSYPAAKVTVLVGYPDNRRRDVHNLMPTVKACIDGCVDAGLLPDDSDKHLQGPDLRVSPELSGLSYAFSFTFIFELLAPEGES